MCFPLHPEYNCGGIHIVYEIFLPNSVLTIIPFDCLLHIQLTNCRKANKLRNKSWFLHPFVFIPNKNTYNAINTTT